MSQKYQRDDIYLCEECWQFHNLKTDKVVDVPYTEMPADLAVFLMMKRSGVLKRHPPRKAHNKRK